jgi:predicted site-specific integrase-resolvase
MQAGKMHELSADQLAKISMTDLITLVKHGNVRIMTDENIQYHDRQEIMQRYLNLRGIPIHIGAASRKYGIPHGTISRWVQRGVLKQIGKQKNRVLLDEQEVAYCAAVYQANQGQGRWLFDDAGNPYNPKRRCE